MLDEWGNYLYSKDIRCPRCGVDFVWFEYIKIKNEDGSLRDCTCPGNKENVTKCPNYIQYRRDLNIGILLDNKDKNNKMF